jgi:hypothetical protein
MLNSFVKVADLVKKLNKNLSELNKRADIGVVLDVHLKVTVSQYLIVARTYGKSLQVHLKKLDSTSDLFFLSNDELFFVPKKHKEDLEKTIISVKYCLKTFEHSLVPLLQFTSFEYASKYRQFK